MGEVFEGGGVVDSETWGRGMEDAGSTAGAVTVEVGKEGVPWCLECY